MLSTSQSILRLIGLALLIAPALEAQCAHQGTTRVKSKITLGPQQSCGTGFRFNHRGLEIHSSPSTCPAFAVYEPPHNAPTPVHGFYTVRGPAMPIEAFYFACSKRWLFGFIPVGSHCEMTQSKNISRLYDYDQKACKRREGR